MGTCQKFVSMTCKIGHWFSILKILPRKLSTPPQKFCPPSFEENINVSSIQGVTLATATKLSLKMRKEIVIVIQDSFQKINSVLM